MTFDFYSDPSHGWLKVPIAVLREHLGARWRSEFSPFSYERSEYVYLEEDCDLGWFMRRMEFMGQTIKIRQRPQSEKRSRIRSYSILAPM
jgi:hypothetical protein